jgi:hypothetical protein
MLHLAFVNSGLVKGPTMSVQWTDDGVLKLIELYQGNECLWNAIDLPSIATVPRNQLSSFW